MKEQVRSLKKRADIGEVIKKKEKHRRTLAALPFERESELVFKLKERRSLLNRAD